MFYSLCLLEALKVIITLNSKLSILNLQPSILNLQLSALNSQFSILNSQLSTSYSFFLFISNITPPMMARASSR